MLASLSFAEAAAVSVAAICALRVFGIRVRSGVASKF
jgi:hypothetical protein